MYSDQVFPFTPKGDVIALPHGATLIDFAYAVHTDIGDTCVGAKINGRLVPLRTELRNGDQVEIVRSAQPSINPGWEKFRGNRQGPVFVFAVISGFVSVRNSLIWGRSIILAKLRIKEPDFF